MRMIIGNRSEWVCRWVAEQLGYPDAFQEKAYGIAIIYRDEPVAGVVYHDWSDQNVFISIATTSPHWCSRLTMRAIFGYAFNQMQVKRVSVIISAAPENKKWRKMIHRMGFAWEGKLEGWFGDESAHIFRMKRDECKWIENEPLRIIEQQRTAV